MDAIHLSSLDHYFADFVVRMEGQPRNGLWRAAALVSAVSCRGDVCLDLAEAREVTLIPYQTGASDGSLTPDTDWAGLLNDCATVGRPGDFTPLVLDDGGRLYLHRSWGFEQGVAEGILVRTAWQPPDDKIDDRLLDRYFPPGVADVIQREAARTALQRRFTVITGGPGTGKTSTVARILAVFAEQSQGKPSPRILLAAPTGKAAARLKQSITQSFDRLGLPLSLRAYLPDEVSTLHRLLGTVVGNTGFRHHRLNPLNCDLLVVDEASMIDLPLMARLLDAVPDSARIILLGDRDQLSSVEAGAVLADICSGTAGTSPDSGTAVIQLEKSYRFDASSGIGALSRLVNAGDGAGVLGLLAAGNNMDLRWRQLPQESLFPEEFASAVRDGYAAFSRAADPLEALDALERFRVLTPHRDGRCGVAALNRQAESVVLGEGRSSLYRPVMIIGNKYELELFNGDIGVAEAGSSGGRVCFSSADSGLRLISLVRMPSHESALVMTIHKSQGSEFDRVLIILPDQISPVLCRELLYTAITRARTALEIWANEDVLLQTVERRTVRRSALAERLKAREGRL